MIELLLLWVVLLWMVQLPVGVVGDFAYMGDAPPEALHKLVFCVQQRNLDKLNEALHNVSTPTHPDYLKHWSREEVGNLTANPAGTAAVLAFLSNRPGVVNVTATPPFGEYVTAWAPASEWNELFNTTLSLYHNPDTVKTLLRAAQSPGSGNVTVTLPPELTEHVGNVFNLVYAHHLLRQKKTHEDGRGRARRINPRPTSQGQDTTDTLSSSPDAAAVPVAASLSAVPLAAMLGEISDRVTPALINRLYGVTSNTGSRSCTHTIYSTIGQSYSLTDHALFTTTFGLPVATIRDFGGHMNDSACVADVDNCAESNLDLQYIHAMSQGPVLTAWYDDNDDAFVSFMKTIASQSPPPNVISISYGISETAMAVHYSGLINQFDTEAQKAGLQGTSIFVSSGDHGSIGGFKNVPSCDYDLSWPASSPYVTAVGATMGPEAGIHSPLAAETVCSAASGSVITSGGGFSIYYDRPSWQESHAAAYLSSTVQTFKGNYFTTGMTADTATRAIPDVSALGNAYNVFIGGEVYALSGTSASAPVFAGLVSQINSARADKGLGPLGWLNPTLYAAAAASSSAYATLFTDVTKGNNNNYFSGTTTTTCTALSSTSPSRNPNSIMGWAAAAGWDPATGLGTPKYAGLKALLVGAGVGLITPTPTTTPVPSAKPSSKYTPSPTSPTLKPTPLPTRRPTPAPSLAKGATAAPTLVVLQVVAVTLSGLRLSDVSGSGDAAGGADAAAHKALRDSLRWSLAQVLSVSVSAVGEPRFAQTAADAAAEAVAAGVDAAKQGRRLGGLARRASRGLASPGLTVSFTLTTTTAAAINNAGGGGGGSTATAAASAAASTTAVLQAGSSTSEFLAHFTSRAAVLGATVPAGVQVTSLAAADDTPTLAPSPAPVPASKPGGVGTVVIVGIAGGVIGGVVVIAAFYWRYYSSPKGTQTAAPSTRKVYVVN